MDSYERDKQYALLKEIALLAFDDGIDMEKFITSFFTSPIINQIVNYSDITYFHPQKVYKSFAREHDIGISSDNDDISVIYYALYIYLKFYYRTNEPFIHILKQLPYQDISKYYELYHTLNEERVIFMTKVKYNLKMNPIRKLRGKDNVYLDTSEGIFNLYIAKHLYLKMFDYPEIRELTYKYHNRKQYLANDRVFLYTCFSSGLKTTLEDEVLSHIKYNHENNVLFIFPDTKEVIDKKYLEDIFVNQNEIPFDKIFIYSRDKLSFINSSDGYREFYINITSLDNRRIQEEFRNRFNTLDKSNCD